MVDHASTSIPPPKNWQDFERCCRILFECILKDPQTQLHGRQGQKQYGVDIFGRRGGSGDHWVGVQCKGKDAEFGHPVTEKELRKEAKEANDFNPTLSEFILVTTASNDAKIQKIANQITKENAGEGRELTVAVWGWGELESRIVEHHRAITAFHPDATIFSEQLAEAIAQISATGQDHTAKFDQLIAKTDQILAAPSGSLAGDVTDDIAAAAEAVDKVLHKEIDGYRDLIRGGQPRTALNLLEQLKGRAWDTVSNRIKFRIVTNIGAAKFAIGDQEGAVKDFFEAATYQPKDAVGMANLSLAHLLTGDNEAAIEAAKTALREHPNSSNAAAYLIQAHTHDAMIEDPLSLISDELYDTPEVRVAVIVFCRQRGQARWREEAREGYSLFPDDIHLKQAAAEADLDLAFEAEGFLLGQRTPIDIETGRLRDAAQTLEDIWSAAKNSEAPGRDPALPHNLAQAYRVIGDDASATRVIDEALILIRDFVPLVRLRALLHLFSGDEAKALELLSNDASNPETLVLIAEIQIRTDTAKARETLDELSDIESDVSQHLMAGILLVECHIKDDDLEAALAQAKQLSEEHPKSTLALCNLVKAQELHGDVEANNTLTAAKELLKDTSIFFDRFVVAEALESRSRHDEVVDVLENHVGLTRDTPALRLFLAALINSDRRRQAHELVEALPEEVVNKTFFLRAIATVHEIRGDLEAAQQVLERYLEDQPNDLPVRLRWVDVRLRSGGDEEVKKFLQTDVEALDGTASDRMRMALLLDRFGFGQRALEIGYQTFVKHRDDPQIHLRYTGLLLRPANTTDFEGFPKRITENTAFVIENTHEETDTFLIEPDPDLRFGEEVIAPEHLVAQKALGRAVGETFVLDEKKAPPDEWKVVSIKHKWLHALHQSMERFERRFPAVGGLERVVIDETAQEPLAPVLARVKERHDSIQTAFDLYARSTFPFSIVARNLGSGAVEAWRGLAESGHKFRVCVGTEEERRAAVDAIRANDRGGCVVDPITLHVIRRLGVEKVVASVCGRIAVPQSGIDTLRSRREEIISYGSQSYTSMFWRDGQYYRDEIDSEQVKSALVFVEEDLEWIESNCDVLPAEGTKDLPAELRNISLEVGSGFFDEILTADGSSRLLLCEDYAYRKLAEQYAALRASWLQPVLMEARDSHILDRDKYNNAVISLIEIGHDYTTIDAQILLSVARDEESADMIRFARVAEILGVANAKMSSHIPVAVRFLKLIWAGGVPLPADVTRSSKIIECLIRNRMQSWSSITAQLSELVGSEAFRRHLIDWLKGHFLIPF